MEPHRVTIDSYQAIGAEYPEGDISPTEAAWIEQCLQSAPRGATVFEFGSGLGSRSLFIESLGWRVQRSDVAGSFLEHLSGSKPEPMLLDLLRDPLPLSDVFYASAVLLHFPKSDMLAVLRKVFEATRPGGIFFFSLKEGEGEGLEKGAWGERYFAYWREEEIVAELLQAGWESVTVSREIGETAWIEVLARKY